MSLKLGKVSRGPHLPTLVASSLSREIAQGRLLPGAQLPTEQSLAQTFGVSRNVIREAIARLRSEGRVWSQQGRGAFVSDTPHTTVLTIDHDVREGADAFRSLFELRGILEVEAASLSAERRKPEDLDIMRAAQAAMTGALYGSTAWLDADLALHRAVATATRNNYIVQFLGVVAERVRDSILVSGNKHRSDDLSQLTLGEHEAILDAIEARDPVEARRAMAHHLANAARRVGVPETAVTEVTAMPATAGAHAPAKVGGSRSARTAARSGAPQRS
ncbi:MAG TPA: FadR/GntR family transcriptional regulator [Lichenihabitans sp.]|jgi:DNA-binding FadR family transcriptional regulator|nr:FadR/GntR family transcriptional regulator [Lichenihabitans sp.]